MKPTFRDILAEIRPQNIQRIADRMVLANRLAKTLAGRARAKAYDCKARCGGRLVELNAAKWSGEVSLGTSCVIVGLTCENGVRVHAPLKVDALGAVAVGILRRQVGNLIGPATYRSLAAGQHRIVQSAALRLSPRLTQTVKTLPAVR
jgi:hypothetical protein